MATLWHLRENSGMHTAFPSSEGLMKKRQGSYTRVPSQRLP
jgi:hypothetical protein